MLDQFGEAVIGEATGKSSEDPQFCFNFPQQQGSGIGRNRPAVKTPSNFPLLEGLKIESIRVTLCLHRVASRMRHNLLFTKQVIAYKAARRNTTGEKCGLGGLDQAVMADFPT